MEFSDNPQLKLAYDFVRDSGCNVFLTGKAGTGKTTFLHNFKKESNKRMVVLAPTGVAAVNAGGVTIHSFFQLPFGPQLPFDAERPSPADGDEARAAASRLQRFGREKINIIKSIDLMVIDEISMVRADLLDAVDTVLRRFRDRERPFGGVQLLMIGDLQQLAPVVREDDWEILSPYYDSAFFFSSRALQQTEFICIELKRIYRQQDEAFIRLLNRVRDNQLDEDTLGELNRRHLPGFSPPDTEGYITLTTHNRQSREINISKLKTLKGTAKIFKAEATGEYPEVSYPTDVELELKVGAQVMFVKNDISPLKLYYNGRIGTVTGMTEDLVYVQCPGDEAPIAVGKAEWQNCRYALDDETREIKETVIGTFTQHPLKLAWAITIHKSQGLTFDKAIIDARAAFAHGQVYVALSRCTGLEGLVLSSPLGRQTIKSHQAVKGFTRRIEEKPPDMERLRAMKNVYQKTLALDLFDFSSIKRQMGGLLTLARRYQSSIDVSVIEGLDKTDRRLKSELAEIAVKFQKEVLRHISENPDVEGHQPLQDRIMKACAYFSPRTAGVLQVLSELVIETDNKDVRKSLQEALKRLGSELYIKGACLSACEKGFRTSVYLNARSRAAIEIPRDKKPLKPVPEHAASRHPEFFIRLKSWRDIKAETLNLSGHMVLPRRTLLGIADELPVTTGALMGIKGMGKKKMNRFGPEILEMINAYCREKNIVIPLGPSIEVIAGSTAKGDTKKLSLELFLSGKTVAEIAAIRKLKAGTIEEHLSFFVGTGQLDVKNVVSSDKIIRISNYFKTASDMSLGPAKAAFGDDISYGEIKCVLKHMEFSSGKT